MSWLFQIEVRGEDGALVGRADASAGHCVEDALFHGVRCGELPNHGPLPAPALEPRWQAGHPIVAGLSVGFEGRPPRHYGRRVFADQARDLIKRLRIHSPVLAAGELSWNVLARGQVPKSGRPVRTTRDAFPLEVASLPNVALGSYEVRIEARVLWSLHERVRSSGSLEYAELLLGRLRHDPERSAIELSIEDAMPLAAGRSGHSSIHFSIDPRAIVAARRAARDRVDGLLPCGWHHNHNPCEGCFAKPDCRVDWVFFSEDDLGVHATLFSRPHMVALVGGKIGALPASRPGFRLYGWQRAEVRERCFRVEGPGAAQWNTELGAFSAPAPPQEVETCPTS